METRPRADAQPVKKDWPAAEIERAGNVVLPAHAISTKNKHLLAISSIPARGFTAAVSVFWGTPPPKPLNCKNLSIHSGARMDWPWAHSTGGKPLLSFPILVSRRKTSSRCRRVLDHRCFTFRSRYPLVISTKQKTLLTRGKQGGEIFFVSLPAHLRIIQTSFGTLPTIRPG